MVLADATVIGGMETNNGLVNLVKLVVAVGRYPSTVRGSIMNPNDHPHGGGEGKAPVGRKAPSTP